MNFMLFLADSAAPAATQPATHPVATGVFVTIAIFVVIALVFDFLNGFHDAANSIATIVATRVLTPTAAVIWAASFNFLAAFVFGTKVAGTIANQVVNNQMIDPYVVASGMVGAILWNIITWILGLPTSSSHALMGGLAGAAVIQSGFRALIPHGWILVIIGIFAAPIISFILGNLNMVLVSWLARRATPGKVDAVFRKLQIISAAFNSLSHGGNDAQKTMGIIVLLLTTSHLGHYALPGPESQFMQKLHIFGGHQEAGIAWWIILSCTGAIALGTMCGGWRIVKTMGNAITRLQPASAFCADFGAATAIAGFTKIGGVPISTTHAVTGAILGVGTTRGLRYVRWIWGQRIITAWILTIPCSAFMAAIAYLIARSCLLPLIGPLQ